jgi:hypothetical protein
MKVVKVEPSLWIPIKNADRSSRADGTDEKLSYLLTGHHIFALTRSAQKESTQEFAQSMLFDCGQSQWLSDTLAAYELTNDESVLKGTIEIQSVNLGPAGLSRSGDQSRQAVVANLKIELSLEPMLECIDCSERFRQLLSISETFRIQSIQKPTQDPTHAKKNRGSHSGHEEDEIDDAANNDNDLLDNYVLQKKGVALDEVLLDTIECSIPDYPKCSRCSHPESSGIEHV